MEGGKGFNLPLGAAAFEVSFLARAPAGQAAAHIAQRSASAGSPARSAGAQPEADTASPAARAQPGRLLPRGHGPAAGHPGLSASGSRRREGAPGARGRRTSSAAAGATPPSLAGHPLYPYGFMLPNDPLPHICNWVSANGPCDKRFATSEELLSHLRTHTAFPGTDKLLSGYPSSSSLASAAAAAMACHMHIPTSGAPGSPGTLALRSPHHALGLSSRYHPYSKSPLPTPGAPVPVPAATGPYYSPYALYGQRGKIYIYAVSIYPKQRPRPGGKLLFPPPPSHLPTHPNFIKVGKKISFDFL